MSGRPILLCSALVILLLAPSAGAADLSSARTLYASASYEEALTMLASLEATENVEQVNQLRALCLLALGRTPDAEQAIQAILLHNPAYTPKDAEVSPKLVTLFHEVRRRTLPTVLRSMYGKAKSSYDARRWPDAAREFSGLLALLGDPDMADQQETFTDLRQLSDGFLKLSELEIAAAAAEARKAAPPPEPTPAPPPASPVSAPGSPATGGATAIPPGSTQTAIDPAIYSTIDRTVTPPVELRRTMPRWSPPNRLMATLTHTALLEIVIDETGAVTSATVTKSITPAFDESLVQSTRNWRYTPARKDGKPVRFRMVLEIVLRPSQK